MSKLTDIFIDRKDGGLNDRFYILLIIVLTHAFYYKLLIPGQMIFGTDLQNQSYPVQVAVMREIFANGYVPEWNPYMNAGMPLLASFSFHTIYPGTWIFYFMPTYFAMGYLFVMHTMLMGIFFYLYAREIGLRRESAFLGGLMSCFALHYISLVYPAHGGKVITITFLPLAFLFIERAFKSDALMNFLAVGLVVGVMYHGGHPQILFYCGIAMSVYFLFMAAAGWRAAGAKATLRMLGLYVAAFAVGTLLYAIILLPAWEYKGYTHRGEGVAGTSDYKFGTSFSQPPEDMLYVPLRNPFGWGKDYGPTIPTTDDIFYRGRIGLRLSIDYFPALGLVLAIIGAFFVPGVRKWIFAAITGMTLFLALGGFNPFYEFIFRYVPGFSFFRIPYAIMILLPIGLSGLGALGFDYLLTRQPGVSKKSFAYLLYGLAAIICVTFLVAVYWSADIKGAAGRLLEWGWVREMLWGQFGDMQERLEFFVGNMVWFVGLSTLALALVFLYRKGILKPKAFFLAAALFLLADTWSLGWDFIFTVPYDTIDQVFYKKTEPIKLMLKDKESGKDGKFRTFAMTDERQLMYYGLESATGYHPVILDYFEKLVRSVALNNQVLQLLNVRYFMTPADPRYDLRKSEIKDRFEMLYEDKDVFLYRLKDPSPRAHLVTKLIAVTDNEQAFGIVTNPKFDALNTAVILQADVNKVAVDPGADVSTGSARYTHFEPDSFTIAVDAPADSLLVVSEIWYPGWHAYVDGVEADVIRTDYAFRGIPLKMGSHTVEMKFTPGLFRLGALLSGLTLVGIIGLFGYTYHTRRKKRKAEEK